MTIFLSQDYSVELEVVKAVTSLMQAPAVTFFLGKIAKNYRNLFGTAILWVYNPIFSQKDLTTVAAVTRNRQHISESFRSLHFTPP